jgi:hypothetical protein
MYVCMYVSYTLNPKPFHSINFKSLLSIIPNFDILEGNFAEILNIFL